MNTINTTAWANLKKNKGRNILMGIAILLTTFLIFTITTLGSGMIRLQFEAANQLYPAYHFMYRSVSEKTAEDLSHHADIADLGLRQDTACLLYTSFCPSGISYKMVSFYLECYTSMECFASIYVGQ